jgi:hypothetical protein
MAVIVLKTALSFGKACRLPGCAEFKATFEDIRFKTPPPRQQAPTAAEIVAVRAAAHQFGHHAAAFAYAVQFETSLRQWDVIGEWIPLADPRPSAIIQGQSKWIGPTRSQIDEDLVFRLMPSEQNCMSYLAFMGNLAPGLTPGYQGDVELVAECLASFYTGGNAVFVRHGDNAIINGEARWCGVPPLRHDPSQHPEKRIHGHC